MCLTPAIAWFASNVLLMCVCFHLTVSSSVAIANLCVFPSHCRFHLNFNNILNCQLSVSFAWQIFQAFVAMCNVRACINWAPHCDYQISCWKRGLIFKTDDKTFWMLKQLDQILLFCPLRTLFGLCHCCYLNWTDQSGVST